MRQYEPDKVIDVRHSDPEAEEIGYIRVVDESGDDYLYPATCFIDAHLPKEVQAAAVKAA